ncbi:polymorphic toxin-type HINT domain-containing protein [Singulisphaera rosea]
MPALLLLAMSLTLADSPSPEDVKVYEAANANVGRDSDAHVRLALWCESHGLKAEKLKHLAVAVLSNPSNATARGLLGLVSYQGKWQRPEVVSDRLNGDQEFNLLRGKYQEKRAKTPDSAEAQWKLAMWCEENGLKEAAVAHLRAVLRLDPGRESALKHMGLKKHRGRWLTEEQVVEWDRETEAQKKADQHWRPLFEKWRGWLGHKSKRASAEQALIDVTDPRAVPMVWAVFGNGDGALQVVAARTLAQIDSPSASRALTNLAVFGKSGEARRIALESLRRRDAREFAEILVGLLREPIKYNVHRSEGPGSAGELTVEGEKRNVTRRYTPPPPPQLEPGDQIVFDESGMAYAKRTLGYFQVPWLQPGTLTSAPVQAAESKHIAQTLNKAGLGSSVAHQLGNTIAKNQAEQLATLGTLPYSVGNAFGAQNQAANPWQYAVVMPYEATIPIGQMNSDAERAAQVAQWQLSSDVERIERANEPILRINARAHDVLVAVAEKDLGEDRTTWEKWLNDLRGSAFVPQKASQQKDSVVEDVPLDYQPQAMPVTFGAGQATVVAFHHACFAKGTSVRALDGAKPIEDVLVGDSILTQDPKSGLLRYQSVVAVYHNPPNQTLRVRLDGESVVATGIHRFWKAGQGWTMARDLKPGDPIRTLGGVALVESVAEDAVQPVFNLEVASGSSFFVGSQGLLVHDNTLVEPVTAPFDAPLAAAAGAAAK